MLFLKADHLNAHCHCSTLDTTKLSIPQFFSPHPHFVSRKNLLQIQNFVQAYERLVHSPFADQHWQPSVGSTAGTNPQPLEQGIFNSYDFHIAQQGPQLIEINSNAAGAVLGMFAAEKFEPCCADMVQALLNGPYAFKAREIVQIFRDEFNLRFPSRELKTVAIVDDRPEEQYFYAEFKLVQELLQQNGITAIITAPENLTVRDNAAYVGEIRLDFIYNRLTDFYLKEPAHQTLHEIYVDGLATVSPNPQIHARYANKSNLADIWSQAMSITADLKIVQNLSPETKLVTEQNRDELWQNRRQWFFKPVAAYGGKGVYRGDKLTTKVWAEISNSNYIAQRYVPPFTRQVNDTTEFKYDLRVYTYRDKILGLLARYYQGQTTNFRTPSGGLASVFVTG